MTWLYILSKKDKKKESVKDEDNYTEMQQVEMTQILYN